MLLSDQTGVLLGRCSEVRDSHDRYANIEISYLLQRMEAYRGLALLSTNLKSLLDTASCAGRPRRYLGVLRDPELGAHGGIR